MKRRLYVEVVLMDMVISAFERRLYVEVVFKDMVISASVQRIGKSDLQTVNPRDSHAWKGLLLTLQLQAQMGACVHEMSPFNVKGGD